MIGITNDIVGKRLLFISPDSPRIEDDKIG
jgi:hypothetical protein